LLFVGELIFGYLSGEACDFLSRKFELLHLLLPQHFDELLSVGYQDVVAKAKLQNVGHIVVLLSIVGTAPVDVWS